MHHININGNDELLAVATKHKNDIVLIDFSAKWCGPCKALAPKLHALVDKLNQLDSKRVILCVVDVDENDALSEAYKITAMPTLVWISNMNMVGRVEGADIKKIEETTRSLL